MNSDQIGGKNFKLYSSATSSFSEDAMFKELLDGYTVASSTGTTQG